MAARGAADPFEDAPLQRIGNIRFQRDAERAVQAIDAGDNLEEIKEVTGDRVIKLEERLLDDEQHLRA